MNTFLLDIITPQRKVFSEKVEAVFVPTSQGTIGVLPRHEPLFTALSEGELKIVFGGKEYFLAIGGGFMEVRPEGVAILVSRAWHAHELNEAEIRKAMEAARTLIARKVKGEELTQALSSLRRSVLQLKIVRKRRPSFPVGGPSG